MNSFSVWYVLTTFLAAPTGLQSGAMVCPDKPTCEQNAQRFVAAEPAGTVRWACHEMTIETKTNGDIIVKFPNY